MDDHPITREWLLNLSASAARNSLDEPRYWASDQKILSASASIHDFSLGTGESIYANAILPAIEAAEREVLLITCFWARSKTLYAVNDALLKLSAKGQQSGRKIRVRIYFSSSSLTQKLFHPQTLQGRMWDAATWKMKLGLPAADEIPGVDLQVKSIFLLPFSVMHPKFVIVDRTKVLLPSCNVSWEDWFEGSVTLSGEIVSQFVTFWRQFWATEGDARLEWHNDAIRDAGPSSAKQGPQPLSSRALNLAEISALFLPSPHHRNPRFAFLPWQPCPPTPVTPLNTFLLRAISNAQKSIYIQTPNLTAPPILSALLAALRRGVDLTVVTSEELMVLEQLVTAGTTTARCMRKLVKLYKRSGRRASKVGADDDPALLETGHPGVGHLAISYYAPQSSRTQQSRLSDRATPPEPVQSHLKLSIVDDEWTVLGSGNLDRASVFTSQELGVAFYSRDFAATVREEVDGAMEGRKKVLFDSAW